MNDKQKRFVSEYLIDCNATRAYVAAGYSPKLANTNASKILQNTLVAAAIKEAQDTTAKKLEVTREELIQDLMDIKNDNKHDLPMIAIKSIEVISKMAGFNSPIEIKSEGITINVIKPKRDN